MTNEQVIWYLAPENTVAQSMSVIFSLTPFTMYGCIPGLVRLIAPYPAIAFLDHMVLYVFLI
jgi:EamA domain-containing membrane protein RarD